MKKRENGFVLIETLIVVLLLTVTLMGLYSSFAYMINKTREKNNHDSIETLYKTYFIKDVLNSNYSAGKGGKYSDSFLYYVRNTDVNNKCSVYAYSGVKGTKNDADAGKFIICDYTSYLKKNLTNEEKAVAVNDVMFNSVVSYNVQKLIYVDYNIINNLNEDYRLKLLNNFVDASTIDYIVSQGRRVGGNNLIIKYQKDYTGFLKTAGVDGLAPEHEIYHSSVPVEEISKRNSSTPLRFYSAVGGYSTDRLTFTFGQFSNGSVTNLPDNQFVAHDSYNGKVLIGWTTDGQNAYSPSEFISCKSGAPKTAGTECYDVNSPMTVTDNNRSLYAVWCGDGTVDGMIKCHADITTPIGGVTNGVYRGACKYSSSYQCMNYVGSVDNNYYVFTEAYPSIANRTCFKLVGDLGFGHGKNYKAIYAGVYKPSLGKCDETSYVNNSTYGNKAAWDKVAEWFNNNHFNNYTNAFDTSNNAKFCRRVNGFSCADGEYLGYGFLNFYELIEISKEYNNNPGVSFESRTFSNVKAGLNYLMKGYPNIYHVSGAYFDGKKYFGYINTSGYSSFANENKRNALVRPVVSFKKSAKIKTGKGTAEDPFVIVN